jgi:hypothetical protein
MKIAPQKEKRVGLPVKVRYCGASQASLCSRDRLFIYLIPTIMLHKKDRSGSDAEANKRLKEIQSLFAEPLSEMINGFIVEMDAKNKPYLFILETGLFSQYIEYCLNGETFGDIGREQVN